MASIIKRQHLTLTSSATGVAAPLPSTIIKPGQPATRAPVTAAPEQKEAAFHVPVVVAPVAPPPATDDPAPADAPAAALLAAARQEAEAIRTAALAEAATIHEQARQAGYQAGLAEGQAAAARTVDASIERLRALAAGAVNDRAAMLRDAERQVLQLAEAIARAVIRREVALDPTIIANTLEALLAQLQGEVVTAIHVHPDDASLLTRLWSERARSDADHQVQIVADQRIARGGCLVETTTGAWDATLGTQLEAIQRAFRTTAPAASGARGGS